MKPKILIIGSTGKLGTKLLNYSKENNIQIYALACFTNKKTISQKLNLMSIKHLFYLNLVKKNCFLNF